MNILHICCLPSFLLCIFIFSSLHLAFQSSFLSQTFLQDLQTCLNMESVVMIVIELHELSEIYHKIGLCSLATILTLLALTSCFGVRYDRILRKTCIGSHDIKSLYCLTESRFEIKKCCLSSSLNNSCIRNSFFCVSFHSLLYQSTTCSTDH